MYRRKERKEGRKESIVETLMKVEEGQTENVGGHGEGQVLIEGGRRGPRLSPTMTGKV